MVRVFWEKFPFIRFLGMGAIGWIVYYGLFYALGEFCGRNYYLVWAIVASAASYAASFPIQRNYVFAQSTIPNSNHVRKYLVYSLVMTGVNEVLLCGLTGSVHALCGAVHCPPTYAEWLYFATPLVAGGGVAVASFFWLRNIFAKTPDTRSR